MIIWNIFQFRKLASLPDVMPKNESKRREIPPENYKSIREFGAQNFDCLEWICLRFYLNLETMRKEKIILQMLWIKKYVINKWHDI